MHLHDLPPEVLGEILAALHDPTDLHSFLAASPDALRVFNLFRNRILLSVSLNAIEPEARSIALAVGNVPKITYGCDGKPIYDFLDNFFRAKTAHIEQCSVPTCTKNIASFTGMVCRILYFVDKFSSEAWALLQSGDSRGDTNGGKEDNGNNDNNGGNGGNGGNGDTRGTGAHQGAESKNISYSPLLLSRTERAAFQRAFFLMELYGTAFRAYQFGLARDKTDYGLRRQIDHFLTHIQPWELEAMWCVFLFYAQLIDQKTRLVEDDFVAWALATPNIHRLTITARAQRYELDRTFTSRKIERENTPPPNETDAEIDERRIRDSMWKFFYMLDYDLHGISFFSTERREEDNQYQRALSLMVNLRSLFAYRLEHSDGEERAKTAIAGNPSRIRGVFFNRPALRIQAEAFEAGDDRFAVGTNAEHNAGYALFRCFEHSGNSLVEELNDRALNCALRERAYVLWDAERIQQPAIMANLLQARNMPRKEADRLYNDENRFGPSVQERLNDVGLYHCDMESLKKKTQTFKAYDDL